MKRKILKVKRIKRYSPFANALLSSKHPMDFAPADLGSSILDRSDSKMQSKGYGRVRTKLNHKRNN